MNWLFGAAILTLLVAMPTSHWIRSALGIPPSPEADRLISACTRSRSSAWRRSRSTTPSSSGCSRSWRRSARAIRSSPPRGPPAGDRLGAARAAVLSIVIGGIATSLSTPAHPLDVDAGFSVNGWLAVLLTFLLARVFAEGTLMRDDLEGTV